ncbi:MAG TPA: hypothetical protein VFR70_05030 [Flavobacterium sp.]|nr:hypothetical protein [Flavobacterium sp.]
MLIYLKQLNLIWKIGIQRGNSIRIFTGTDFKKNKTEKSYKGIRQRLKTDLRKWIWAKRKRSSRSLERIQKRNQNNDYKKASTWNPFK